MMTHRRKSLLCAGWCMVLALTGLLAQGDILLQTGFEQDTPGKLPENPPDVWQSSGGGFEISTDRVKEGKQSLAVLGGGGDQALAAMLDTQSEVVSAEFWLYVDGAARSLTVFLDLLIYEGDVLPEGILGVSQFGKLATTWASLKQ